MTAPTTPWRWRVRLVHVEAGCRVVEVSCQQDGQRLAMALGEAETAEIAEDRARQRLQQQLHGGLPPSTAAPPAVAPSSVPIPPAIASPAASTPPAAPAAQRPAQPLRPVTPAPAPDATPAATPAPAAAVASAPTGSTGAAPVEPEDWSEELAMVDAQLQRLGWDRQQEGLYLERCFGHPSRSRITLYQDLVHYVRSLQQLDPGADPATATVRPQRHQLLRSSDALLQELGWPPSQGRAFLEQHFGRSSRQQLSDEQLQQFNLVLEQQLPAAAAVAAATEAVVATGAT